MLITISDDSNDSDEEPMIFIPGSPVLVPDDGEDDDISILEVNDSRCFNITFSLLKTQMDGFSSSSFFSFFFAQSWFSKIC